MQQALADSKIRFEAIHRYELDDDSTDGAGGMRLFTRRRLIVARARGRVLRRVRGDRRALASTTEHGGDRHRHGRSRRRRGSAPSAMWYWTMAVSPNDPNALVLGHERRPLPLDRRRQDLAADRPEGPQRDEPRPGRRLPVRRRRARGRGREPGGQDRRDARRRRTARPWSLVSTDERQDLEADPSGRAAEPDRPVACDRPATAKSLYALLNNGKLYLSTDGAESFKLVSPKIGDPAVGDRGHAGQQASSAATWTRARTRARTAKTWQRDRRSRTRAAARW